MNHPRLLITAVLALGVSSAIAEVDLSKLPAASAQKDITFAKDIKPIFEASCFRCHGEKQKKGGIRVDSVEAILKGGKEGKIVEVGNAVKSDLLISVSYLDPEVAMPPKPKARKGGPGGERREGGEHREGGTNAPAGGPGKPPGGPGGPGSNQPPAKPLTPDQVGLVRAWIDQGCK